MSDATRFELRPLTASTPGALYERMGTVGWPFTEQDCAFLQASDDVGVTGLYAHQDGSAEELIGSMTLSLNDAYSFVGLVTVSDKYRRRGLATQLLERAIRDSLEARRRQRDAGHVGRLLSSCRLTATTMGAPVYRRLGFVDREEAMFMELHNSKLGEHFGTMDDVQAEAKRLCTARIVSASVAEASEKSDSLASQLWRAAMALDEEAIEADRARLLREYLTASGGCVHFLHAGDDNTTPTPSSLVAWCAVRPCSKTKRSLGPLIARSADVASDMLALSMHAQLLFEQQQAKPLLSSTTGEQSFVVFTDSSPTDQSAFLSSVRGQGFKDVMTTTVMYYDVAAADTASSATTDRPGESRKAGVVAQQYAYLDGAVG